ncbi:MAG: prepilin-type N-terminal cleavage/methylation domain-containing protein [Myxococcota bacterium]
MKRKTDGFTLIELMIVVAIIGILAAIAIPAFINYIKRSKTSEAATNLKAMATGASVYYGQERGQATLAARGAGALTVTRCVVADGTTGNAPSQNKTAIDWSTLPDAATFQQLNATPSDPVYYRYDVLTSGTVSGACGDDTAASGQVYTHVAVGDLDGDGTTSRFELAMGVDNNGQLYRNAAIFRQNELE